ncbi:MAG: peptidoglycan-binding protein [Ignavibacteria bacterium]|nr:peptidoglycan-binding protein [Ignavibacteria bacterium]
MNYPNRVIKKGDKDKKVVKAVQEKLNEAGCGPLDVDGDFGNKTFNAVKLFQARSVDENGNALIVDGKIGPITWSVLFGENSVPVNNETDSDLLSKVVKKQKARMEFLKIQ